MTIEIKKDEEIVKFKINEEDFKMFSYENLSNLIDLVCENDEQVNIINEEDLEEYKNLISDIIEKSREDDYRHAVSMLKETRKKIIESEIND